MAKKQRNEVTVGVVVFVVLVLTVYVIIALGDWENLFTSKQEITIKLPYTTGLKGLMRGSPVFLGGAKIGQITETGIHPPESPDNPDDIYVYFTVSMPDSYQLREDCVLSPQSNVLGGQASLAVKSLGETGRVITDGETVELELERSIADAINSLKEELDGQMEGRAVYMIKEIIRKIDYQLTLSEEQAPLIDKIHEIADAVAEQLDPEVDAAAITKLNDALAKFDESMATIQTLIAENRPTINEAIGSARGAIVEIEELIGTVKQPVTETITSVRNTAGTLEEAIPTLVAKLEKAFDDASAALDAAKQALTNADKLAVDLRDVVTVNRPRINSILTNLDEAGVHAKLVMRDIRRNPWRLRHPEEQRQRDADLVGAAGDFADGAEKLKMSAETLEALLATSEALPNRDERLRQAMAELEERLEKLDKAEQSFWEKMK